VFGLTTTSGGLGRSDGPVIAYTANGNSYGVQEQVTLVVAAGCSRVKPDL